MALLCFLNMTSTFLIKGLCPWQDLSLNFLSTLFLIIMCQLKCHTLREALPVYPVETDDPLYLFIVLSQHFSCIFHTIHHNLKLILLICSLVSYLSLAREEAPSGQTTALLSMVLSSELEQFLVHRKISYGRLELGRGGGKETGRKSCPGIKWKPIWIQTITLKWLFPKEIEFLIKVVKVLKIVFFMKWWVLKLYQL